MESVPLAPTSGVSANVETALAEHRAASRRPVSLRTHRQRRGGDDRRSSDHARLGSISRARLLARGAMLLLAGLAAADILVDVSSLRLATWILAVLTTAAA